MSIFKDLYENKNNADNKYELTIGVVTKNFDSEHEGMVKVGLPLYEQEGNESDWMRFAPFYGGKNYGAYFLPEVGDTVLVAHIDNDTKSGIVLGSIWNKDNPLPPKCAAEKNFIKKIVTKGGHQLFFDDEDDKGGITIQTKKELQITLLDEKEVITIKDKSGKNLLTIDSQNGAVEIDADKSITIKGGASSAISIEGKDFSLKAKTIKLEADMSIEMKGQTVKIEAQSLEAKGNSNVKVESSAVLTLKGSMTKIN